MIQLSVVVITLNEEKNIRRCLESMKWADEIILIDSQSTDRTLEIAKEFGAKIYSPPWRGFGPAKKEGVDRAQGKWILSLDADEVLSEELASSIKDVIQTDDANFAGYYMKRKANFLGRWINHCGWYPDPVLRLFLKGKGNFDEAVVHEKVILEGETGMLKGDLLHYSYPDLETYFDKFNRYTTMGAEKALAQGKRAGWFELAVKPVASFFKHYISKQGFRDGKEGFIISVLSSTAVLAKYTKLFKLQRNKESGTR